MVVQRRIAPQRDDAHPGPALYGQTYYATSLGTHLGRALHLHRESDRKFTPTPQIATRASPSLWQRLRSGRHDLLPDNARPELRPEHLRERRARTLHMVISAGSLPNGKMLTPGPTIYWPDLRHSLSEPTSAGP